MSTPREERRNIRRHPDSIVGRHMSPAALARSTCLAAAVRSNPRTALAGDPVVANLLAGSSPAGEARSTLSCHCNRRSRNPEVGRSSGPGSSLALHCTDRHRGGPAEVTRWAADRPEACILGLTCFLGVEETVKTLTQMSSSTCRRNTVVSGSKKKPKTTVW